MINAKFEIENWDEKPVDDGLLKITHTSVSKRFTGDLVGTSQMNYVMVYNEDGTAALTALERIDATIGDKKGTFVLRHVGGFADGAATADIEVLADFGSGDFAGVTGSGTMIADPAGTMKLDLNN